MIDIEDSNTPLQITLILNHVGSWGHSVTEDVSNSLVVSEIITSIGGVTNFVQLNNSGGAVTTLTINGNTFLQDDETSGVFVSQLNSVNASADTGGLTFWTNLGPLKPSFTFTGGSGTDCLGINTASLDALTSGSQLNGGTATSGNILAIHGLSTLTGTSALTGEYKTLNATKGFQIL